MNEENNEGEDIGGEKREEDSKKIEENKEFDVDESHTREIESYIPEKSVIR